MSDYEGDRADSELGGCHVYKVAADSGQIIQMVGKSDRAIAAVGTIEPLTD